MFRKMECMTYNMGYTLRFIAVFYNYSLQFIIVLEAIRNHGMVLGKDITHTSYQHPNQSSQDLTQALTKLSGNIYALDLHATIHGGKMAVYRRECRDRLGKAARLWWRYAMGALSALVIAALGSFGQRLFCSHAPKRTNHHHNHTDFLSTATHNLNPLFNESETVVGNRTGWKTSCIGRSSVTMSTRYNYSLNYSFANSWR